MLYRGGGADDPGAYDDRAWLHASYTVDGVEVMALAHVEYHGETRPGRCAAGTALACWRNAVVELRSQDGGRSFVRRRVGGGLALSLFGAETGSAPGYFNPSNVVRRGDWLYAFVWAEAFGAQRRGACLMRRPVDGAAGDWRAWDGQRLRGAVRRPLPRGCGGAGTARLRAGGRDREHGFERGAAPGLRRSWR